ncbi:hypothetical protein E0H26_13710 [Micromonospora zingiberis]|uniref:Uncharacterized protein n=1 Tax=Micromonospora zingiberis TaxID=2053011 RepID=A0A4V2LWP4_9ACTN|nr:hypothetical protein [Micromonospora zingiberis]TCB97305.1 hypothetical protein E0H26_13710 [Micromonospora zingiberis]
MVLGWARSRWAKILLGFVVGAAVGVAIYHASRLTGRNLFVLCGATAGGVAAVVVHGYSRNVRLTDVTISVPQFSDLHFAVTRDSQQVAWKLFVEAVTRISTQPLNAGDGLLREALTSLYGLFATTREVLKESQPSRQTDGGPTVEHLAIAMLNVELRPFLSRWHPILGRWESAHPEQSEAGWPLNAECRSELAAMQKRLLPYIHGFGKLAGVRKAPQIVDGTLGPQFASMPAPRQAADPTAPN